MTDTKDLLTVNEAAELTGFTPRNIRRVVREGDIPLARDRPMLMWKHDVVRWSEVSDNHKRGPEKGTKYKPRNK
ncbi:MAG: helix-turn-helix domain-containing protein [Chloroflexota bacterium]